MACVNKENEYFHHRLIIEKINMLINSCSSNPVGLSDLKKYHQRAAELILISNPELKKEDDDDAEKGVAFVDDMDFFQNEDLKKSIIQYIELSNKLEGYRIRLDDPKNNVRFNKLAFKMKEVRSEKSKMVRKYPFIHSLSIIYLAENKYLNLTNKVEV